MNHSRQLTHLFTTHTHMYPGCMKIIVMPHMKSYFLPLNPTSVLCLIPHFNLTIHTNSTETEGIHKFYNNNNNKLHFRCVFYSTRPMVIVIDVLILTNLYLLEISPCFVHLCVVSVVGVLFLLCVCVFLEEWGFDFIVVCMLLQNCNSTVIAAVRVREMPKDLI